MNISDDHLHKRQHLRRRVLRTGSIAALGLTALLGFPSISSASPAQRNLTISRVPSSLVRQDSQMPTDVPTYPTGAPVTLTLNIVNNNQREIINLGGSWTGNGIWSANPVSCADSSVTSGGSTTCTLTFTPNAGANAVLIKLTANTTCGALITMTDNFSYIGIPPDGTVAPQ